jgi:CRP-like cAMP-binding protein
MKDPQPHLETLLARSPLFGALRPADLAQLSAATRERRYPRGAMILQKGDRPAGLYLVAAGKLKEVCQSPAGEERVIEVIGPNQTCGEAALFLDCPYPFFVAALTNAQLLHIDKAAIDTLIDRHPGVVKQMLSGLSQRTHTIMRDIESCALRNPVQRIVAYLADLAASPSARTARIALPAAKFVIASRLGITPEALSRALRDLGEAGVIEVGGSHIVIPDMARFREYA